jgi:hypothetical protein
MPKKGHKQTEEHKKNRNYGSPWNKGLKAKNDKRVAKHCNLLDKNGKPKNYKGGRLKQYGYIKILVKDHPFSDSKGYVFEHRVIMEKKIGRYLKAYEFVHHRNGIRDDNRIENLEIMTKRIHYGEVECPYCNNLFLIR